MLYPLINHLKAHLPQSQWHFLLTAYELSKGDWIERMEVITAARLSEHSSNVSELTSRLKSQGLLDIETHPNGRNAGTIHIRLTRQARDLMKEAFTRAHGKTATLPS